VLRSLGLVMGIFDLKVTPDDDVVFFEINVERARDPYSHRWRGDGSRDASTT
jgi:hypothetical protein